MQATARIYVQKFDTKKTINDLYPVKLRITYKRDHKYYSIKDVLGKDGQQYISDSDITKIWPVDGKRPRGKYKDLRNEYDRIEREAIDVISGIEVFSFGQFEDRYFNKAGDWDNFVSAMVEYIQTLKNEGRFGYATSFESTLRAVMEFHLDTEFHFPFGTKVEERIKKYLSGKKLRFADITATWLKRFENKLKENGKSRTTIGIYMRNIRVLFNIAIKDKKVKAEYPFTAYKPKTAQGRKLALTALQISLIANYETKHPQEQFYRDIFMFSFLANGLNLADICRIKYSDIQGDEISVVREKTKYKDRQEKLIFHITPAMQKIINTWGVRAVGFDSYIFPILKPEWSDERNYNEIKQATKQLNKYIRRVAIAVGINEKVSSYTARHSWATIAKNSGASIEYIKESLGHSNVSVTENYLKSFEKGTRKKHSEDMEKRIYTAI